MRILITAGGTGGHVFPALVVAEQLRATGHDIRWLGTPDSLEARLVPEHGFALETIPTLRLRKQGIWTTLKAPLALLRAIWQARRILHRWQPEVVLGMGGFAAGPGGLAALWRRIPLVIHEQNAIAGLTNRILARFATQTLSAFADAFPAHQNAIVVGNPVRNALYQLPPITERQAQHPPNAPLRLLVLGGSLGAQALNEVVPVAVARLTQPMQILHQAGQGKTEQTRALYQAHQINADVVPFISDMASAYASADLVLCRSGALTVAELAAVGCAAILVPYPHAVDDHQTHNAAALVQAGAAQLIHQKDLTPETLATQLQHLSTQHIQRQQMAAQARTLARPEAAAQIATACLQVSRPQPR
jgi:UDP-N-acetylglucosamine--N-acetylmuramyl-(pentapeptide) pyrophosphoryl-undecaprenol N-acetylglucosamine transferase